MLTEGIKRDGLSNELNLKIYPVVFTDLNSNGHSPTTTLHGHQLLIALHYKHITKWYIGGKYIFSLQVKDCI